MRLQERAADDLGGVGGEHQLDPQRSHGGREPLARQAGRPPAARRVFFASFIPVGCSLAPPLVASHTTGAPCTARSWGPTERTIRSAKVGAEPAQPSQSEDVGRTSAPFLAPKRGPIQYQ